MIRQSERFGEQLMRSLNSLERDRTQNRIPLLLIALWLDLTRFPQIAI
jgi:hypothetical protein